MQNKKNFRWGGGEWIFSGTTQSVTSWMIGNKAFYQDGLPGMKKGMH